MKKSLLITLSLLGQTSLQTAKQVSENKTDITIIIQYGKMDSNFRKVSRIPFTLERIKSLKLSFFAEYKYALNELPFKKNISIRLTVCEIWRTRVFTGSKLFDASVFDWLVLSSRNVRGCGKVKFSTSVFPFLICIAHAFSFLFNLKVREHEKLEALFLKLHEDWNDLYSNVHVLHKTPKLRFSRSVSKDDGRKVARWLHSNAKWLHSVIKSVVF